MKSYDGYKVTTKNGNFSTTTKTKDYFTVLEESPNTPNFSTGTIKADTPRLKFDLEAVKKTSAYQQKYRELKVQDR